MKNVAFLVVALYSLSSFAQLQNFDMDPLFFLIKEKRRIDLLDGKLDNRVTVEDSSRSELATKVYMNTLDSIWFFIPKVTSNAQQRDTLVKYISPMISSVRSLDFKTLDKNNREFSNILLLLKGIYNNDLLNALLASPLVSLNQVHLVLFRPEVKDFLMITAKQFPQETIMSYGFFYKMPYTKEVIENAVERSPNESKKFLIEGNPINDLVKNSSLESLKLMTESNKLFGKKSSALVLSHAILEGKYDLIQADKICKNQELLIRELIQIKRIKNAKAEFSVERELENQSIRFVRKINDLHNESDAIRFANIKNFNAQQLYTLIIYSEEEIFTSTFNGILNRMFSKMGSESSYVFLKNLDFNRFRTFIKQLASYGKLTDFLSKMSKAEQKKLVELFVADLEKEQAGISQAVEVADAFSSIKDTTLSNYITALTRKNFERVFSERSKNGVLIYGLLSSLMVSPKSKKDLWEQKVVARYPLPNATTLSNSNMFNQNTGSVWHMYFYDDEDGLASFQSFKITFGDDQWQVVYEDSLYIHLRAYMKILPIEIYANKPKAEYEGQAKLELLFDSLNIQPDVLIHRGHSYYAIKTIEKLKPSTKLFILGSCGGYHNISTILQKAPEAQIVSSKQIGVMAVNNPLLKMVADNVKSGDDVDWPSLWKKMDAKLKVNKEAYSRFLDYIPPHKNVSAAFIKAYMRQTGAIQ